MSGSYTWGTREAVQAVIDSLPARYPMSLNADDMEALLRALTYAASDGEACAGEAGNPDDHESGGSCLDTCWRMRAMGLASSIAENVEVEWI